MMTRVWKWMAALLLLACTALAQAVPAADARGALLAVSDGKGGITLVWVPPPGPWPAAWQVSDDSGRVWLAKVARGDASTAAALAQLDPAVRDGVEDFDAAYAKAGTGSAGLQAYVATVMRVFTDTAVAKAMASSVTLSGVAPGARRYVVAALDAGGRPTALRLTSVATDAGVATPAPESPRGLFARNVDEGVALGWDSPAASQAFPVFGHVIEAVQAGRVRTVAAMAPVNAARIAGVPVLVDREAAREAKAEYRVYAVGPAGLRSAPATVTLFVEDMAARVPPREVRADAAPGVVTVRWNAAVNPHTRGALVERTQVMEGTWEVQTPTPVTGTSWQDEGTLAGGTYYYRVRFTGPRGDAGAPSVPASARAIGRAAPAAVTGLVADPGRTRITLRWNAPAGAVAGYRVERDIGTGNWVAMTGSLLREPRFDDDFPGGTNGLAVSYRIAAVAFDEQQGAFAQVRATLPDILPPPAPRILSVEAGEGGVRLAVATPGLGSGDRLLLLRAREAGQVGVVVGEPRPLAAALVDATAEPGTVFWYRVVALDAAGNRSEVSPAAVVRVPVAPVPAATAPTARFQATPLPHVKVGYGVPPAHLKTLVQWRAGDDAWQLLAGPVEGAGEAVQVNVPRGVPLAYRVAWINAAGNEGEPSPPVLLPAVAP